MEAHRILIPQPPPGPVAVHLPEAPATTPSAPAIPSMTVGYALPTTTAMVATTAAAAAETFAMATAVPTGSPYPSPGSAGMATDMREDSSGRWVLEPDDVLLLERVYALERCPGRELRQQLATRLRVKPRQIQVWFQNKRQRMKNGSKPTVAEARAHAVAQSEHEAQPEPAELLMSIAAGSESAAKVAEDEARVTVARAQAAVAASIDKGATVDSAAALWDAVRDDKPGPSTTMATGPVPGSTVDPVIAAQEIIAAATATVAEAQGAAGLPDGYTDGVMLWIRTDLLMAHPELLGHNAMPIFLVNNAAQPPAAGGGAIVDQAMDQAADAAADPAAPASAALAVIQAATAEAAPMEDDLPVAGAVQAPPM